MAERIQLEIVTPDRLVVKDYADDVQIPGKNGYLGIMAEHAPLITELAVGEISYRTNGYTERLAVAWGFAEVLADKVTVLAETAERAAEIDVARAEEAKKRAEAKLASGDPNVDYQQTLNALRRAEVRLKVASERAGGK
ncbi:MAG: F0F1 ATP synthase subunit epsilon [Terriglobales bacterium]